MSLRCALDKQVEFTSRLLAMSLEVRKEDRTGDVHFGVVSMWVIFKAMKLNEISMGVHRTETEGRLITSPGAPRCLEIKRGERLQ